METNIPQNATPTHQDIYDRIEQFCKDYPTENDRKSGNAPSQLEKIWEGIQDLLLKSETDLLIQHYLVTRYWALRQQYDTYPMKCAHDFFTYSEQQTTDSHQQLENLLGNAVTITAMIQTTKKYWLQGEITEAINCLKQRSQNTTTTKIMKWLKNQTDIALVLTIIEEFYHLKRNNTAHHPNPSDTLSQPDTVSALIKFLDIIRTNTNVPPQAYNLIGMAELYTRLDQRDRARQCLILTRKQAKKTEGNHHVDDNSESENTQFINSSRVLDATHIRIPDGRGVCPKNIKLFELLFSAQAALGIQKPTLAQYMRSKEVANIQAIINRTKKIKTLRIPLTRNIAITAQYRNNRLEVDLSELQNENPDAFHRLFYLVAKWNMLKQTIPLSRLTTLAAATNICDMLTQLKDQHKKNDIENALTALFETLNNSNWKADLPN